MAYIQPNSTIEFFADLGLDAGYENTMYFASASAKDAYFDAVQKIASAYAQSYTRSGRGVIKVQFPMSTMYRVGYMRFKNTSFENKWFYAFVTGVDYINNITTEVRFEIDVMMTWMGDFELEQCFIERQHSETDTIGSNIIDEGIPCGDYNNEFVTSSGFIGSNGFWFCLATTFDPDDPDTNAEGGLYGGVYSGAIQTYTNDVDELNRWLDSATRKGKTDGIIGISIVPYTFITDKNVEPVERQQTFAKPYNDVDGYVPKNNKMFSYPYKSLQVTNLEGNFAEFRYELFGGNSAQFEFIGVTGLNTEIVCAPLNYKKSQQNLSEKISMNDFPMCSWSIDSFKAWLAQNKSSISANVVSSVTSGIMGLATAGASASVSQAYLDMSKKATINFIKARTTENRLSVASSGVSTANGIIGQLAQMSDYARKPPQSGGSQGTGALFGRGTGKPKKDFWFIGKTITAQYAKVIDDYFTMFGYKQNVVDTPNMNARPNWTYCKTIGCVVKGQLPSDDAKLIESIFDDGVRFWKNHANIGNYSLNNAPA